MASTHEYTDASDIKRLIPDISDSDNFDSDSEIDAYISEAEALVNSKLSVRYSVPFTDVPAIIKYITGRITVYNILVSEYTGDSLNENEWVDRYKDAIDMLSRIVNREIRLTDDDGNDLTEGDTIESTHGDYTPIFDVDDILDSEIDSDLLEDISDDRD